MELDLGYIAGLFDADGCVYMYNAGRKEKRINRGIYIKNCSTKAMGLCRAIKNTLGYGNIYEDSEGIKYIITKKDGLRDFCSRIGPLSVIKQEQYKLMNESCSLIFGSSRGSKYLETKDINNVLLQKLKDQKNNNEKIDTPRLPGYQWLAGMLDGDGYISFSKVKTYYNRYVSIVVMSDILSQYLASHLNGTVRVDSYYNKENPLLSVEVKTRRHLKAFLDNVTPHLFMKREKALIVLASLEVMPDEKGPCNNNIYSENQLAYLDALHQRFVDIKI